MSEKSRKRPSKRIWGPRMHVGDRPHTAVVITAKDGAQGQAYAETNPKRQFDLRVGMKGKGNTGTPSSIRAFASVGLASP